jgi:uncharacterized OsmC-like protein
MSEQDAPRKSSILRTFKAVAWSFFGVRRASQTQEDMAAINPVHLIVVGLFTCLAFVLGLIVLVNWVVAK